MRLFWLSIFCAASRAFSFNPTYPKNDELCRKGDRNINLDWQFPPFPRDQRDNGTCYSYPIADIARAAKVRAVAKIRGADFKPSDVPYLSPLYVQLKVAEQDLNSRSFARLASIADKSEEKYLNGGGVAQDGSDDFVHTTELLIRDGRAIQLASQRLEQIMESNANETLTDLAKAKGAPWINADIISDYYLGQSILSKDDIRKVIQNRLKMIEQRPENRSASHEDLAGFSATEIKLPVNYIDPNATKHEPAQRGSFLNFLAPARLGFDIGHDTISYLAFSSSLSKNPFFRAALTSMEWNTYRDSASTAEFYAREINIRVESQKWTPDMSKEEESAFFGRHAVKKQLTRMEALSPGTSSLVVDILMRTRNAKEQLRLLLPPNTKFPRRPEEAQAFGKKIDDECEKQSEGIKQQILSYLCQGIPLYASSFSNNLEVGPSTSGSSWDPLPPETPPGSHAMSLIGIQKNSDGRSYYIFRNSHGKEGAYARLPLNHGCYLNSLGTTLNAEETRARKPQSRTSTPVPDASKSKH